MAKYDFDIFVIGAGSGGVRAARLAAQAGKTVAVAEESRPGGTCVVRGCVPKKFLVYGADFGQAIHKSAGYGWSVENVKFDWPTLRDAIQSEVSRLSGIYSGIMDKNDVTHFAERAEFKDAHTLILKDTGKEVTAETILVATGGRPWAPQIPGAEVRAQVAEVQELNGITLKFGCSPKEIKKTDGGYIVTMDDGTKIGTDLVYSQSSVKNIYAVGDVTNRVNLTPVAIREGAAFVDTVVHGNKTAYDHSNIASAVFTRPPVGTVGVGESEARKAGRDIHVYTTNFRPMANALSGSEHRVFMKIIIQGIGIAVKAELTKAQFDETCAVHPTIAEELVTMKTKRPNPAAG